MKNHFDKGLNVRELLLTYRPRNLLELGALYGENTLQILKLRNEYPFRLLTITTGSIEDAHFEVRQAHEQRKDYIWVNGVSYEVIPHLTGGFVDFCSIDTDHTFECLEKELEALKPKLFPRCIIVCHDTVSFPELRVTIEKFIKENDGWMILRETKESCGAIAISRLLNISYTE